MKKLAFLSLPLLAVFVSACGFDGTYRYSCQDPENWGTEDCVPPKCNVDGNCTEILLGFDPLSKDVIITETTDQPVTTEVTQETVAP